ncbi:MAG: hypothetical protein ACM3JD_03710 [Rudaea sp.]
MAKSDDMARETLSNTMKFTLLDSGHTIQVSGNTRDRVENALGELAKSGAYVSDLPHREGGKWTATCHRFEPPGDEIQIDRIGNRLFLRTRSLERLRAKVAELSTGGGTQEGEIIRVGAFYTAVYYDPTHQAKL